VNKESERCGMKPSLMYDRGISLEVLGEHIWQDSFCSFQDSDWTFDECKLSVAA
jgi:hypothetical protein